MHRSGDDNSLKYLDFAVLDIIAMQLSCLIMYWASRGGNIYQDPKCRLLAHCFLVAQIALGMFSDNYYGAMSRDARAEFFKLLLYILELWLCCAPFVILARVPLGFLELFMVTMYFLVLVFLGRMFNKWLRRRLVHKTRKVVLITSSELVRKAIARIQKSKTDTSYKIIAVCLTDNADLSRFDDLNIPVYSTTDPDLLDKLVTQWIDDAFFLAGMKTGYLSTLMEDFVTMGITVHYSMSAMNDFISVNTGVQSLGVYKVITSSAKLISYRAAFIKRTMDILGSLAGLLATAILFVFIAPPSTSNRPAPSSSSRSAWGRTDGYSICTNSAACIWTRRRARRS